MSQSSDAASQRVKGGVDVVGLLHPLPVPLVLATLRAGQVTHRQPARTHTSLAHMYNGTHTHTHTHARISKPWYVLADVRCLAGLSPLVDVQQAHGEDAVAGGWSTDLQIRHKQTHG